MSPLTFDQWRRLSPSEQQRLIGTPRPAAPSKPVSRAGRAVHPILPAGAADPPSLPHAPRQAPIFDPAPHRNRGMQACPPLSPGLTNQIIAMAVHFGMPRAEAEEARSNPFVRAHVAMLACLIWDAAAGNADAKRALERIAVAFHNREKVSEIIAAYEQPAQASELEQLLGLD